MLTRETDISSAGVGVPVPVEGKCTNRARSISHLYGIRSHTALSRSSTPWHPRQTTRWRSLSAPWTPYCTAKTDLHKRSQAQAHVDSLTCCRQQFSFPIRQMHIFVPITQACVHWTGRWCNCSMKWLQAYPNRRRLVPQLDAQARFRLYHRTQMSTPPPHNLAQKQTFNYLFRAQNKFPDGTATQVRSPPLLSTFAHARRPNNHTCRLAQSHAVYESMRLFGVQPSVQQAVQVRISWVHFGKLAHRCLVHCLSWHSFPIACDVRTRRFSLPRISRARTATLWRFSYCCVVIARASNAYASVQALSVCERARACILHASIHRWASCFRI